MSPRSTGPLGFWSLLDSRSPTGSSAWAKNRLAQPEEPTHTHIHTQTYWEYDFTALGRRLSWLQLQCGRCTVMWFKKLWSVWQIQHQEHSDRFIKLYLILCFSCLFSKLSYFIFSFWFIATPPRTAAFLSSALILLSRLILHLFNSNICTQPDLEMS